MVLHYGLDAFNGYVAFGICILMLTVIYINLQELFKKTLSPFLDTLFMKFPNYRKKRKVETEDSKGTTEEEPWTKEAATNPPPSMDYAQIRLSAMKAKEQAEQEKLTTVLTYTRESFAPYMKEDDLNILCEYICLFHADKNFPKVIRTVKVDSAIRTIDLMHFGWNIGYGFGDTSAASENMLFYGGKAHKLSQVRFHIPQREGRDDFLSPWRFTSDDGRFEMKFVPILDRAACTDVKLIKSDQHQVFGHFTGTATLDDGTVIRVRDMIGFAEKVENKW